MIIGFAGLTISQIKDGISLTDLFSFSFTSEGFMLIYGLLAALATMLAKKLGSTLNSFVMTGWNVVIGGFALLLIGLFMGGDLSIITWTPLGITLLIISAGASVIPFSL